MKETVQCPECGGVRLEHLNSKAKKSDCDQKCPACGEIDQAISMLKEMTNL